MEDQVQIQVIVGGNVEPNHVAVVIFNCPVTEVEINGPLHPAFKLNSRQAMEVGMNLIFFGKMAESKFAEIQKNG